jgi:hypothetical protein
VDSNFAGVLAAMERGAVMTTRFVEPKEDFQIRHADPRIPITRAEFEAEFAQSERARLCPWSQAKATLLKNASHDDAGHGLAWCMWNGDRTRGWGFYCTCGFSPRLSRSFEDGLTMMENHWQLARAWQQEQRSVTA